MSDNSWDMRFYQLAECVAGWSKDPSQKVGAVIVRPDKTIASVGFNGFPRGIKDTPERLNDRETKLDLILHAEENAILNMNDAGPFGQYTIYCTLFPCVHCAKIIIQRGIGKVVSMKPDPTKYERWMDQFRKANALFEEAWITRHLYYYKNDMAYLDFSGKI